MPREWLDRKVYIWLDPRSSERGDFQIINPEGILKRAWPGMIEIETDEGVLQMVMMAHVVTITTAKETA